MTRFMMNSLKETHVIFACEPIEDLARDARTFWFEPWHENNWVPVLEDRARSSPVSGSSMA